MRSIAHFRTLCVGVAASAALLAACEDPNKDEFRRNGGAAPDPTGIIEGTVLYVGPRPLCRFENGVAVEVAGNVILTMFEYENPPPPTGGATGAISLLTIPGESMFALADCLPETPSDEDRRPITRSASFIWPELALGRGACPEPNVQSPHAYNDPDCPGRSYQIRGFFDYDNDFNPFFSVRNLPSAGDIAGGAFVSTTAVPPIFQRIAFGNIEERPDGELVDGVAVTLGVPVSTERPIFELDESTRALMSTALLPTTTDHVMRERQLLDLTGMRINSIVPGTPEGRPSDAWLRAMAAGGIDSTNYYLGSPQYGFYVSTVDANSDGTPDLHPILGAVNIPYLFPIPIVRRARNPVEQRVGLPDVLIVGTIRPTLVDPRTSDGAPLESMNTFEVGIPPVAVMVTNPARPVECRVPIIPPGNLRSVYTRIPVDCQELPTGNYDVSLLSGLAGARIVDAQEQCLAECDGDAATCMGICNVLAPTRAAYGTTHCARNPALDDDPNATPARICSGSYSGQAWSLPNELGCPDFRYRVNAVNQIDPDPTLECGNPESAMLPSQSREATFAIVDAADDTTPEQAESNAPGHGIPACTRAPELPAGDPMDVAYMPVPEQCCPPALTQFCNLPLCPLRTALESVEPDPELGLVGEEAYPYPESVRVGADGSTRATREMRVRGVDYDVENGRVVPRCTPFMMPADCCRYAEACAADPCGADCPEARRPASCGTAE